MWEKAKVAKNPPIKNTANFLFEFLLKSVFLKAVKLKFIKLSLFFVFSVISFFVSFLRDSSKNLKATRKFMKHIADAIMPGLLKPKNFALKPPKAGPMVKPRPIAAPIKPMYLILFFSSVLSVMYA